MRDPLLGSLTNPQTQNRYPYVWSNPVNRVDPAGLKWFASVVSTCGNGTGDAGDSENIGGPIRPQLIAGQTEVAVCIGSLL